MYGTFRSGEPAGAMLQPHCVSSEPASVPGRMVLLPEGFPALLDPKAHAPNGGTVVGELIELRDLAGALALMDAYEGEDYERVLMQVVVEGGEKRWAWCYQLAAVHKAGDTIPGGDWVRFRRGQSPSGLGDRDR